MSSGTYALNGDLYALKVTDSASRLFINEGIYHYLGNDSTASRTMRRVLIDYARARKRAKRGGASVQVALSDTLDAMVQQPDDLLSLEEALTRLETQNERQGRVVECRCFAGMSVEETAVALGTSPATVKRDWAFARAWLQTEVRGT